MMTVEEMKALALKMGPALSDVASSYIAPINWTDPTTTPTVVIDHATVFFVNTGKRIFAVTASHVYNAFLVQKAASPNIVCCIANRDFDLCTRVIADDPYVDIATFEISEREIRKIGKTVLTGSQNEWPPAPPQQGKGVFFAGYPSVARKILGPNEIEFGIYAANTVATEVTGDLINCQFNRKEWIDHLGLGLPEENYDLSGISGAPLLTLVENDGVMSWRLGGVIYCGPRGGEEMILARSAKFICGDGSIKPFSVCN